MPGPGEILVLMALLLVLPLIGFWIWMLVDCASKDVANERLLWLLVIVFAGFIGALLYLLIRRPARRAALGR